MFIAALLTMAKTLKQPTYVYIYILLFSHVRLFATPWTVAHQASLSLTISWTLPKFMFIASVMLSSRLIL